MPEVEVEVVLVVLAARVVLAEVETAALLTPPEVPELLTPVAGAEPPHQMLTLINLVAMAAPA